CVECRLLARRLHLRQFLSRFLWSFGGHESLYPGRQVGHAPGQVGSRGRWRLENRRTLAYRERIDRAETIRSPWHRMQRAMGRATGGDDGPRHSSRRGMLKQTAGAAVAGAAVAAMGTTNPAQEPASAERAVKNGRIKQSIVYWCFEKHWDMPQAIKVAKQLGCVSIELVAPRFFPQLKQAGLSCAIGTVDMAPDPPFLKGFNNPKYRERVLKATRDAIDACAEHGFSNVICFTGMREGIPDDVGAENCVVGFKQIVRHAEKKNVTLCLEMLNSRVS